MLSSSRHRAGRVLTIVLLVVFMVKECREPALRAS
jgi:hypothetical protein